MIIYLFCAWGAVKEYYSSAHEFLIYKYIFNYLVQWFNCYVFYYRGRKKKKDVISPKNIFYKKITTAFYSWFYIYHTSNFVKKNICDLKWHFFRKKIILVVNFWKMRKINILIPLMIQKSFFFANYSEK